MALKKPNIREFAEQKPAAKPVASKSGLVPDGDTRLSCNIDKQLHFKLKTYAARLSLEKGQNVTIGEVIEGWIEQHCD